MKPIYFIGTPYNCDKFDQMNVCCRASSSCIVSTPNFSSFRSPPSQIMEIITNGRARLFQIFSEVEVPFGETLHMENDDEALHVARSFFFSWKLLLLQFSHASQQLRAEYANYLQQRNFLSELLEALFRVLPKKPRDGGLATESTFTRKEIATEGFVHCLALETYYNLLRTLPALVRHWWNGLEKKYALIVER